MPKNARDSEKPIDPWFLAELACWTAVVLSPFLRWVNGPAVSTDQFVVRIAITSLPLIGGIAIRVAKITRSRAEDRRKR